MSLRIQNNAINQAKRHDAAKQTSAARLASGKHINKASEGAAELAASAKLSSAARSVVAATSNARRAVSFGQIADGALGQIQQEVMRIKELAVSASSDTFDPADRAKAHAEVATRLESIDKIVSTTRFGDTELLSGGASFNFQIAENAGDEMELDLSAAYDITTLGINNIDISEYADAQSAISLCDVAIDTLNTGRAAVGAFMAGMESIISTNEVKGENLEGAIEVLVSADIAKEATALAISDIRSQFAQSMISKENQAAQNSIALVR